MLEAVIYRYKSDDEGTDGFLVTEGGYWNTLELPNRDNKPNVSCIPVGSYEVTRRYSPHFKRTLYHLLNVEDRSFILIHSANFAGDTEKGFQSHLQGCIALGKRLGSFPNKFGNKQKAILSSKKAVREFTSVMGEDKFKLTIKDIS